MQIRLNRESIIAKVLKSEKTQRAARSLVEEKVSAAKMQLLEQFNHNDITKEIEAGPELEKSSILPNNYGNLFSFLGFYEGTKPVESVRALLESIRVIQKPIKQSRSWAFRIFIPSQDDIEKVSPLPFESGRSWVHAISFGIGTFSYYMHSLRRHFNNSHSGVAIQVPNQIRSGLYLTGRKYLFSFLNDFRRNLLK